MSNIAEVIRHFPGDLQDPMIQFWEVVKDEMGVKREDFTELKNIVGELADVVGDLAKSQKELAEAQKRTENRVEELAEAIRDLAISHRELAVAQKHTADTLHDFSRTFDFRLGGLGSRWGVDSESSFRSGLRKILSETGYEVFNFIETDVEGMVFNQSARIEIDVIIKGDRTIVVEIKSSVSKSDVSFFMRKAEFYTHISGRKVDRLLMITPFIDDAAREVADTYQVVICDSISDLGVKVQQS